MLTSDAEPNGEAGEPLASVTYHRPRAELREAITSYYILKVSGPGMVRDRIFPEWTNFRVILSGDWEAEFPGAAPEPVPRVGVTGTLERAVGVTGTAGVMVGVGLMPQGWPRLTRQSAEDYTNRTRPLHEALGPAADELHARLQAARDDGEILTVLDETFLPLLVDVPEAALVTRAHSALQDPLIQTVADLADRVELSSRQLQRFSLRHFGLSPKRLLRRQRVLRTLATMSEDPQGTWSRSLDAQFTDQAHFIREFKYYMGASPRAYLAQPKPIMEAAWSRRKALFGSPVQVLQPPPGPP